MDLFEALSAMPIPTENMDLEKVPQLTLHRVAKRHRCVADQLAIETGLEAQLVSYALLRAMQLASLAGAAHTEASAENVLKMTTRIAARLNQAASTTPPN